VLCRIQKPSVELQGSFLGLKTYRWVLEWAWYIPHPKSELLSREGVAQRAVYSVDVTFACVVKSPFCRSSARYHEVNVGHVVSKIAATIFVAQQYRPVAGCNSGRKEGCQCESDNLRGCNKDQSQRSPESMPGLPFPSPRKFHHTPEIGGGRLAVPKKRLALIV
jgi:hypothetical protein